MKKEQPKECCEKCKNEPQYEKGVCGMGICPCHQKEEVKECICEKCEGSFGMPGIKCKKPNPEKKEEVKECKHETTIKYFKEQPALKGSRCFDCDIWLSRKDALNFTPEKSWEERFEEAIPEMQITTAVYPRHLDEYKIKDFIRTELASQREELENTALLQLNRIIELKTKPSEEDRITASMMIESYQTKKRFEYIEHLENRLRESRQELLAEIKEKMPKEFIQPKHQEA